VLGSGAYGSVYKGSLNGIPVAVKTTNANADLSYLKALLSELKIMIYLGKHPSLVEFLGSDTSKLNKGMDTIGCNGKRSLHYMSLEVAS